MRLHRRFLSGTAVVVDLFTRASDLFGAVHMCGFIFHIAFKKPKFHLVKIPGK